MLMISPHMWFLDIEGSFRVLRRLLLAAHSLGPAQCHGFREDARI
jgi:hypothetical protein